MKLNDFLSVFIPVVNPKLTPENVKKIMEEKWTLGKWEQTKGGVWLIEIIRK